ncbi:NADH dehydrogenase [ubiquinone] 1 alpha subcomplex subunit 9, mitochondrial [Hylaeus anthracinus]|uniref:NADH dehydrogenase [ubiquinone] 1 alpha subcomplex subunit 9, mitochondrial n=1 Tax=Hylaeus anthracinus TaxID=313031 RepID=UPI0023B8B3C5|nr:NADH dehydrogenase [ubiquinone] 1 alpha subcomplex subunit 9, mitochondrial [Hylaeus anthracinus]
MAAWIPKAAIQVAKNQNAYAACYAAQSRSCSSKPKIIKNPTTAKLKRGTGGRSSFNGIVCTIFGCNGFVGRYVCNRLGKIGTQLILPHRCDRYFVMPLKLCGDLGQVLFHPFELRDEESIIRSIKYSNVVVNLVGKDVESRNYDLYDVNVEGARTLARLAKQCNVERFIHVSCLNAEEHPEPRILPEGSTILKTKWLGECAVREEFPEATIIRPSVIYGQEDEFMTHYMHAARRSLGQVPLWEKGLKTEKQPIHVSDVAAGIVAIARNCHTAGKTYQFVGPKRYLLHDLVKWFYDLACRGDEGIGYSITHIKHNPLFQVKVSINEFFYKINPAVRTTWEVLEKQHVSDTVLPNLPTLEDLGITPIDMESQIPWEIKPYRFYNYYIESLGEVVAPPPPKTIPLR